MFLTNSGFTLVEVLVALSILAVIGFIVIPNFRQFNTDQELTNASSNIIGLLQQAQTSGQSQTACVNALPLNINDPATFWDVRIRGDTGASLGSTVYQQTALTTATSIAVSYNGGSSCTLPAIIMFKGSPPLAGGVAPPPPGPGQVVFLSCGGINVASLTQPIVLTVSHSGFTSQIINIESNGTIHQ